MLFKLLQIINYLALFINADIGLPANVSKINGKQISNFTFKNYLQKYNPSNVWRKIDLKNKLNGVNKTVADEFDAMFHGIDETDDLLRVKVQNGAPKVMHVLHQDGRRDDNPYPFVPPGTYGKFHYNRYNLKERFLELMKQAIYQARYKMVIMQTLREKYRRNSVYKMGFLMSKTDNACTIFSRVAMKAFKDCTVKRMAASDKTDLIDILAMNERLINLWFNIDLLIDLIIKNDENCKRMLNEVMTNRKIAWKFYD